MDLISRLSLEILRSVEMGWKNLHIAGRMRNQIRLVLFSPCKYIKENGKMIDIHIPEKLNNALEKMKGTGVNKQYIALNLNDYIEEQVRKKLFVEDTERVYLAVYYKKQERLNK